MGARVSSTSAWRLASASASRCLSGRTSSASACCQPLAGTLQALAGLAVIRILFLYRQPQWNGGIGILVQPALVEGLPGRAAQLRQASPLSVHPRRRPLLHILGGILAGDGHAALPGLWTLVAVRVRRQARPFPGTGVHCRGDGVQPARATATAVHSTDDSGKRKQDLLRRDTHRR